jgi:outer membrane protein OmpA-like peptidoglycan-associated protein
MFKNAAIDWHQSAHLQGLRTAVGKHWGNGDLTSRNFLGDSDPIYNTHIWGLLDVNGSCGAGSSLQVLTLMDSADPVTASAITTKSFVIPEQINLDYLGIKFQISSVGTTLGVTGAGGPSRRDFNAALWGLTTIAETSEEPPAPPAPPIRREPAPTPPPEPTPAPTPEPTPTPAPAATTNLQPSTEMLKVGTVYMTTNSYFLNNATKISLRKFAREVKASDKKVVLVYGYTDNRGGVNNTWLSRQRAKAVANYIRPMLKGKRIVIGWYASGKPVSTGTSAADLALNRRVEIYTK